MAKMIICGMLFSPGYNIDKNAEGNNGRNPNAGEDSLVGLSRKPQVDGEQERQEGRSQDQVVTPLVYHDKVPNP